MSECDKLPTFADGDLAVAQRPAFHRHLATCAACQQALEGALMLEVLATSFIAGAGDGASAPSARAVPPLPLR
jgi:anti-sigma factor RsiW